MKIIAKIENQEGVDNIDEILSHCYGVMVARGDLGVEIEYQKIPTIQRQIIKKCQERKKPVIIATQMLHSMIENPRPTRAEVSELVNLRISDLFFDEGFIRVTGKGSKQRLVPVGAPAVSAVKLYLEQRRTIKFSSKNEDTLFLNRRGGEVKQRDGVSDYKRGGKKSRYSQRDLTSYLQALFCDSYG
jgi:site-specific recombinase XerD